MSYIDGFVIPVSDGNRQAYLDLATTAAAVFRRHGAIRVVECWGDDVPDGKVTDFRRAVAGEPGEAIVFSWIEWPSKEVRDLGLKAAMSDPEMGMPTDLPFDGKRMIFGGFAPMLDA